MYPHFKPMALLPAFAISAAIAQPISQLDTVVVSATRFAEKSPAVAGNISIISREDIRNSAARSIPDLLKSSAGVSVTPLYGNMGIDATVDLRGFGDVAGHNTLILIDGQRMNPIDMSAIDWSIIPLSSIERIEIMRGAGTVLYGDRATGGVINIVTDKSARNAASAAVGFGSFNSQTVDGEISVGGNEGYANLKAHYGNTDGWRKNSQADQKSLAGRLGWAFSRADVFTDFAIYTESSGAPGSIAERIYRTDPKQARNPLDTQRKDGYRVRPGVAVQFSDSLRFEAEVSVDHADQHFENFSFGSVADRQRDMVSLTPRLRWAHRLVGLKSETVLGADYYTGTVTNTYSSYANNRAEQDSTAAYVQNTTGLTERLALTLGARTQRMKQRADQEAYPTYFMPAMTGSSEQSRSAWDAGLAYSDTGWRVYGKLGTTFRFANTDELFGYDALTGNTVYAGNLKPQHGTVREIGGSIVRGPVSLQASAYQIDLEDEIGYDGARGANVNFDPTRRRGLETEMTWRMTPTLKSRLAYTYAQAEFREGRYQGKAVPMVPNNKASLLINWDGGRIGRYGISTNYVGDRHFSGDYANERKILSGYTTVDLLADWKTGPVTISARVLNATNRHYAPYALYSTARSDYFYYPGDKRSFFVSFRYDFK
ncbi:TonB-dependent receptor [Dechloromonas agitata]|uniref:TonB-dependent receptor n=1 Tax=Dechloromonas agitata TaxID=73030 RepID=UPI00237DFDBA|nr:TonB-dependent receptor [Dechloromonas agitata]MDE1544268.1 TonB-dependent receptor [Dechloromonas agitata]